MTLERISKPSEWTPVERAYVAMNEAFQHGTRAEYKAAEKEFWRLIKLSKSKAA